MKLLTRQHRRSLAARARAEFERRRIARTKLDFSCGPDALFFDAMPLIRGEGSISIGNGFSSFSSPVKPQITAERGASIEIGDATGINYGVDIYSSSSIEIGDAAMIATYVSIYDTHFHPVSEGTPTFTKPITIGKNVWLGRLATVLPGVRIGDHSVVAAGAVVTHDIPPHTVAAGVPAKPVGRVEASDDWRRNADFG